MTQPDRIHLRDYVLATDIGAFQSERGQSQRLRINITVDLRAPVDAADDEVDAIMSYDVLVHAVSAALADQRYNLVETLAEKIAAEVLTHPRAARIEVCVEKLDRGPYALGVTITREAGRVFIDPLALPVTVQVGTGRPPEGAVVIVPDSPGLPLPEGGNARQIALLALDQAAWALAGTLGIEVAQTRTEIDEAIRAARAVVWAPARLVADAPEAGTDPQRLGFWLAARLAAQRVAFTLPADRPLPAAPEGVIAQVIRL